MPHVQNRSQFQLPYPTEPHEQRAAPARQQSMPDLRAAQNFQNQQPRNAGRGSAMRYMEAPRAPLAMAERFPGFDLKSDYRYAQSAGSSGKLDIVINNRDIAHFLESRPGSLNATALLDHLVAHGKLKGNEFTSAGYSGSGPIRKGLDLDDFPSVRGQMDYMLNQADNAMRRGRQAALARPGARPGLRHAQSDPQLHMRHSAGLDATRAKRYAGFELGDRYGYGGFMENNGGKLYLPLANEDIARFLDTNPAQPNASGLLKYLASQGKLNEGSHTPYGTTSARPLSADIDLDAAPVLRNQLDHALGKARTANYQATLRYGLPQMQQFTQYAEYRPPNDAHQQSYEAARAHFANLARNGEGAPSGLPARDGRVAASSSGPASSAGSAYGDSQGTPGSAAGSSYRYRQKNDSSSSVGTSSSLATSVSQGDAPPPPVKAFSFKSNFSETLRQFGQKIVSAEPRVQAPAPSAASQAPAAPTFAPGYRTEFRPAPYQDSGGRGQLQLTVNHNDVLAFLRSEFAGSEAQGLATYLARKGKMQGSFVREGFSEPRSLESDFHFNVNNSDAVKNNLELLLGHARMHADSVQNTSGPAGVSDTGARTEARPQTRRAQSEPDMSPAQPAYRRAELHRAYSDDVVAAARMNEIAGLKQSGAINHELVAAEHAKSADPAAEARRAAFEKKITERQNAATGQGAARANRVQEWVDSQAVNMATVAAQQYQAPDPAADARRAAFEKKITERQNLAGVAKAG